MSSNKSEKDLRKLVISRRELAEDLYDILERYVRLTDEGEIILLDNASRLTIRERILLTLSAKKALTILKMTEAEEMKPAEIAKVLGEQPASVRSILVSLRDEGLLENPRRGYWRINWSRVDEIKRELEVL